MTSQVVEKLIRGLAMEDSRNMFALFEHNNTIDKAVESRILVADVLAKFERYASYILYSVTECNYVLYLNVILRYNWVFFKNSQYLIMLLGSHGPVTYDAELHLAIIIRKDQNTDKSVTDLGFLSGWLAMRRLRMTASGSSTLNSTASWMWRACRRKEWSLHSCLSRCVSLLVLPSTDSPSNTCGTWCS